MAGINTWRHMGYTALLIFAGLQTIPRSLYEAAAVDGATERQMFRDITIPLLRPILALVLVITIVGSLQVFDTVFVATGGFNGQPGRTGQRQPRDLSLHLPERLRLQPARLRSHDLRAAGGHFADRYLPAAQAPAGRRERPGMSTPAVEDVSVNDGCGTATGSHSSRPPGWESERIGRAAAWAFMVAILIVSVFPILVGTAHWPVDQR